MPSDDKPHFIEREGALQPASTEEIAPLVRMHQMHGGIAFFPECPECQAARARGEYPQWFPQQED